MSRSTKDFQRAIEDGSLEDHELTELVRWTLRHGYWREQFSSTLAPAAAKAERQLRRFANGVRAIRDGAATIPPIDLALRERLESIARELDDVASECTDLAKLRRKQRGRPPYAAFNGAVRDLARQYEIRFGRTASVSRRRDGTYHGPFLRWAEAIFSSAISGSTSLRRHVPAAAAARAAQIAAVLYPKNSTTVEE